MRRVLLASLGGALLLASCGGAQKTTPVAPPPEMTFETVAGLRVAKIPRSTPGLVHLALFVDAGARDAEIPQLATVAAWTAGEGLSPRVLPDGTIFELGCEIENLSGCLEALAGALGTRGVANGSLDALRTRLVDARRGASTEDARAADHLALRALLRDAAEGFAPLGDAEDDDDLDEAAIASFHAAHYGPARALLVAAGDVDAEALRDGVRAAFRGAQAATAPRAERSLETEPGIGVRVHVGDRTVTSAALATPDVGRAAAIARVAANDPLFQSPSGPRLEIHGFGVRGGALVMARIANVRPARAGRLLVAALGRAALEAPTRAPLPLPTPPRQAAMVLGNAWIGSGLGHGGLIGEGNEGAIVSANADETDDDDAPPPALRLDDASLEDTLHLALGVGAVVAGGRGDRLEGDDPDAPVRTRAIQHLSRAAERAWAALAPPVEGEVGPESATVALADNGARIDVDRRPADGDVAIAVRFLGGGATDPTALHGRAALVAELSATGCGGLHAAGLAARLRSLDAEISPLVDADTHGVVLSGPSAHTDALLDLALSCGLTPSTERSDVAEARLRALARVDPIASVAARAVAPEAPGLVAPRGSVGTIQSVSFDAVAREVDASRVGARTSVAIVGNVDVEHVVARAARRLAALDRGALPTPVPAATPLDPDRIVPFESESELPRVVVTLLARGDSPPGRAAAAAYAAAIGRALSRSGEVRVVELDAGAGEEATWIAIAFDVSEELLDAMPERVRGAIVSARAETVDETLAREAERARWAEAEPAYRAVELSRARLLGPRNEGTGLDDFGPPAFAIGRPH